MRFDPKTAYRATYIDPPSMDKHSASANREASRRVSDINMFARTDKFVAPRPFKPSGRFGPATAALGSGFKSFEASGMNRSLPTNVWDMGNGLNVNHIRARKQTVDTRGSQVVVGSRQYGPKTNIQNFVEERRDVNYVAGPALQASNLMKSLTQVDMAQAQAKYLKDVETKEARSGGGAGFKIPEPSRDYRARTRPVTNFLDAGYAASDRFRTMTGTMSMKPEFQKRDMSQDSRSRMLCTQREGHQPTQDVLEAYRERWTHGAADLTRRWGSEYKSAVDSIGSSVLQRNTARAMRV